jgi:hypothetical protein
MERNWLNRPRHIGVTVNESAFERLQAVADAEQKPLGEWCRERILESAEPPVPSISDFALMAEVAATQAMLIDMLSLIGRDGRLSSQKPQEIVDKAHHEKQKEALDILTGAHAKEKRFHWTVPPTTTNQEERDE